MVDTKIDLTVRSITRIEREKKDTDIEKVCIVARDAEGQYTASFQGPKGSFAGLRSEIPITVTIGRAQKTIQESTEKKAEEKPKKK